jgi:large subunit ribosomal protein L35e
MFHKYPEKIKVYNKTPQVTGAGASKLAKIRGVRKNIARVLTVYNQQQKADARRQSAGKKYIPQDLRPKKTRAIRRALTSAQKNAQSLKVKKKTQNFPARKFALKK